MGKDRDRDDRVPGGWDDAPWSMLVIVCEKCGRRAGRKGLRSDLKAGLKASGHRRVKVVESGCLGVCPKHGIALATPAALALGRLLVLGEDEPVQMAIDALASS